MKLQPSHFEARQALATSYLSQENFRGAADEFREIAALDPERSDAWFRLGHQYLDLSARLVYRGAHLYPESAWGHRFLADLLFQRDRWDEAVQEYRKTLALDARQSGLHTSTGEAFLHAGKLQDAESEFHLELQLDSANELAWLGLADAALAQGQVDLALKNVAKVWEISPEFLAAHREFPSIELHGAAKALIGKLEPLSSDAAPSHFLLASLYAAANENPQSDSHWKTFNAAVLEWNEKSRSRLPAGAPPDPCKVHRYSECVDVLQKQRHLNNSQQLLLGKSQFSLRDYRSAADSLAKVTGVSNENAEADYWLALSYHWLGAEAYARLEDSFPDSWRTHQLRGEGYALRQDLDNALKEFQTALQLRPDVPELHEATGEVFLDKHSQEEAQSELEKAVALEPSRTRALYLLGRLYVQRGDNQKGLLYLQHAVRLQPDLAEAASLLGTTYVRMGQFNDAIPQLLKAAAFDHYGNVHYQLYLAYRKLGESELAQKALERSQNLRRSSLEHDQALILGSPQLDSEPK